MQIKKLLHSILIVSIVFSIVTIQANAQTTSIPTDMFQLPWEQGKSWVSYDGFDNGTRRSNTSPHNYIVGGAIDFAPRAVMRVGEDTSNDWVVAVAAGQVIELSSCHIKISHGNGWISEYWHLNNIQVTLGQTVSRNQRLAVIHNNSTQQACAGNEHPGPHLHFVLRPKMKDFVLSGWVINYNALTNTTWFTKNGQTVNRLGALLNIPNLQIVSRGLLNWDTHENGTVDPYRYERWTLPLTEQTEFTVNLTTPTTGLVPVIVLLNNSGVEIMRASGVLTTTQPAGTYYIQIQADSGTGFYDVIATRTASPTATPTVSATPTIDLTQTTATLTPTVDLTQTTATPTPTVDLTQTTATFTSTPDVTSTPATSTPTVDLTQTTAMPTFTPSIIISSATPTIDLTQTTATPTVDLTQTTATPTIDLTQTTATFTPAPFFTETPTVDLTQTTATPTIDLTQTTATFTSTPFFTETPTIDLTQFPATATSTFTPTAIATISATPTHTAIPTPLGTYVLTSVTQRDLLIDTSTIVTVSLLNIAPSEFASAEFTCTYNQSVVEASNIVIGNLFGADPASAIFGPQNGSFIVAIAGSNGNKAVADGVAFTFDIRGLAIGQSNVACTARVSSGGALQNVSYVPDSVTVLGALPSPTATPLPLAVISGQVIAGKPVTIQLFDLSNNLITSVVADANGLFSFNAPNGSYNIVASAEGYLDAQGAITVSGNNITMPTVTLPAGDIDSNGVIDQFDALTIAMNYGLSTPIAADLNNDGIINVLDAELLALNYRLSGAIVWQ